MHFLVHSPNAARIRSWSSQSQELHLVSQTGAWCRSTWTSIPFPGILAGSWIRGWTAGLEVALNTRCQNYQWRFNLFCHNAGLLKKINFQRFIHLFSHLFDRKERGEREKQKTDSDLFDFYDPNTCKKWAKSKSGA